ncbi:MAG: AAA family ATPase, partial [Gammaproteobacteria bacterium]|nr:AAA family ATPase [Gammaproteobacteria bacterium]
MYNDYFQFKREPFSIAPDPRFLYLSEVHREAFAHLMYGFANSGFVLITGEVGTGKTTLLRNLIGQTPPDLDVAFILNPRLTVKELLETICDELGIHHSESSLHTVKQYIDLLNKHLLRSHREGRSTVMIIDEAQNLTPAVLEQIRLLTNLETDERKLLRIILLGQPELGKLLEREELRQLAQRITARYHLASLGKEDSFSYVVHRLTTAGGSPHIFDKGALRKIYRISKGIPRVINVLADRALLGAYVEGKQNVSSSIVRRAAHEVLGKRFSLFNRQRYPLWLAASLVSVSLVSMAWAYFSDPTLESTTGLVSEAIGQVDAAVQAETMTQTDVITNDNKGSAAKIPDRTTVPQITDQEKTAAGQIPEAQGDDPTDYFPEQTPAQADVVSQSLPDLPEATRIGRPPEGSYSTQRKAYAAVFARWGAQYTPEENSIPCNFAPSVGLQCLSLNGSWSEINQLNLPVILELWDAQAVPYYAAVTAT